MRDYEITITMRITDSDLVNILCGALGTACSCWCSDVTYADGAYLIAKDELRKVVPIDKTFCYEDIILQMLKNGDELSFYDPEDDREEKLSLEKLLEGIKRHLSSTHATSSCIDEWDDNDFDSVIQYALFGDILFG